MFSISYFITSAEANQRECTSIFPVALHILSDTKDPQVIRLLASFLSLTADNNGNNYQCCTCQWQILTVRIIQRSFCWSSFDWFMILSCDQLGDWNASVIFYFYFILFSIPTAIILCIIQVNSGINTNRHFVKKLHSTSLQRAFTNWTQKTWCGHTLWNIALTSLSTSNRTEIKHKIFIN